MIKLAWKNIWRNKVRSGVILTAIALGLFAGTFLVSFMTGYIVDSANIDIKNHLSHFQIHNPAFRANNDINAFLEREAVESVLQNSDIANETKATYRLSINGIIASAGNISVVSLKVVDVEEEKAVSGIWECIPDTMGAFLPDGSRLPTIVISRKLAEHLKVRLTQKLVFSFTDCEGEGHASVVQGWISFGQHHGDFFPALLSVFFSLPKNTANQTVGSFVEVE